MTRRLHNWLSAYAEYTAASEAPEIFNFWTGVSTIAGALRRRVWIDQIKFKWTPNFYIIFVSPPGVATKSTTMSVGMNLLKQVTGVKMGPQSLTWQGLTKGLQEALQLVPLNDEGTFLDKSYLSMSAITCEINELGTMLDPRDDMLMSVLINLWDGVEGKWDRWLKSSENTSIENPWINVIGATTPTWLSNNFPDKMIGGGLTSRIVFVYADKKKYLIPYISELVDIPEHKKLEEDLIYDLTQIANMKGAFVLTPEAYIFGKQWYEQHWNYPEEHLRLDRMQGYNARKQTHVHKLAMILSAAEDDNLIIQKHHIETALNFASGVERDMHIVFSSIGMHQAARDAEIVMAYIRANKVVPHQRLWQECFKAMSRKEFQEAIDSLVHAGYIKIVNEQGNLTVQTTGVEEASHTIQ